MVRAGWCRRLWFIVSTEMEFHIIEGDDLQPQRWSFLGV